jgi:Arc/MetJ-type ribon-helix-helix transcriptional regulator
MIEERLFMTIHLPEHLEDFILEAVKGGEFASVDEAMAEAALLLVRQIKQGQTVPDSPAAPQEEPVAGHKPIWEVADELGKSIPAEEWARLPVDGASEHDHYIYGTPKRPIR